MPIQQGAILISETGDYYRVVDCEHNAVSLMRVGGCTLFACSLRVIQSRFQRLP